MDFESRPRVLIFRNEVLRPSETFIVAQANALSQFEPIFTGLYPAHPSLSLPSPAIILSRSISIVGKFRRRIYWRSFPAPGFHSALQRHHPKLIHAHFALDGATALSIHAALNIPLIVTLHGYDVSSSDEFLGSNSEGRAYLRRRRDLWNQAAIFICISKFIRDKAISKGFPPHKLLTHYTGTDLRLFHSEQTERDRNMILFVGRLVEKKGCLYLLAALEQVRRKNPNAYLVLIGDGPLEQPLRRQATDEHLPCRFIGMQPANVVKDYMSRARVLCVPSVTAATGDSEGLGMVFVEAQAVGTPVVSFQHGGIPEVVIHERTGLLAQEGDVRALSHNLMKLLDDDQTWIKFSESGRDYVRGEFDIAVQTSRLEGLYQEVLSQSNSSSTVLI